MKKHNAANSSRRQRERGGVLAYTVISALFLFFAIGLGADLSHLYLAKNELQNSADAAALAGASALTLPIDNPNRIQTAVDRAVNVMNLNKYNFNNRDYVGVMTLAAQRNLVTFAKNLNGPYKTEGALTQAEKETVRFVHVATPSVPITIFFSIPILGVQRNLSAQATAGLSVSGNANFCPGPLAVLDCGSDNPQCLGPDPDGSGPAQPQQYSMNGVCGAGGPKPNPDGSPCNPNRQFCRNCVYTIRAGPSDGPAPGNYHGLCCPGVDCDANWIRHRLAAGNSCEECPPVNPGDEVAPTTKPGINAGPVRQGINTRFDIYNGGTPPLNPTDHPPDPNIFGQGNNDSLTWTQYKAGSPFQAPSHTPAVNRRIIILPITPFSSWFDANGRSTVRVSSLGGFFIQNKIPNGNGGDLKAEYIGDEVISAVGFDPNNVNNAGVVTWVLYR